MDNRAVGKRYDPICSLLALINVYSGLALALGASKCKVHVD